MTKQRASEIVSLLLNATTADEMFISMNAAVSRNVQFAANRIMRAFTTDSASVQITLRRGSRYASAVGNRLDEDGLKALVASAESQLGLLPQRDLVVPFQGEANIKPSPIVVPGSVQDTWLLQQAETAIELAKSNDLNATGVVSAPLNTIVLASSNGLFLHQQSTPNHILVRVLKKDGSSTGYNEAYAYDGSTMNARTITQTAIDKCLAWQNPEEMDVDRITTVLSAQAFAEMLVPFMKQFDIQAYKDKRSFLAKLDGNSRLGEKMFEEWVNIYSDPYNSTVPALPFSSDGIPIRPTHWIKSGVIHSAVTSRFEAEAANSEPVPFPTNFIMDGGEETLDDIIASTERGLLVTGFANLEVEDPANCLVTGSTRDGLFYIEDGKITKAIQNMNIRETPMYILRRKEALGVPEVTSTRNSYLPMLIPAIRAKDVMFGRPSGII